MSTFKGVVAEFPDIRIDYFCQSQDPNAEAPLACFLSHVHTDHLQGLEGSYNAPFIYCSAVTKELLIRLERRMHRMNWQKGIIETHDCQYKKKKKLLKTIPLETPTWVEVGNKKLKVTLFDANHCVGSVMFLIEGNGKAILYTGDIRAEAWWVDYLKRHPVLLPYTKGVKKLDKIYLDTSWGARGYERFPSKEEGLGELLEKIACYPPDTIFHLNTWTFGYEEVWVALAAALDSQIHLSPYHYRLFMSIKDHWTYGHYLGGFELGNSYQEKIFTTNPGVRIHSCERLLGCIGLDKPNVVYITPIIARIGDVIYQEDGIDFGDLNNNDDFSLYGELRVVLDLLGPLIPSEVKKILIDASKSRKQTVALPFFGRDSNKEISLAELVDSLKRLAKQQAEGNRDNGGDENWPGTECIKGGNGELLPTWLKFAYSRHSSYGELRNLVGAFRPKDVYPCVIDDVSWTEARSVQSLYGDLIHGTTFAHDAEMRILYGQRVEEAVEQENKQQIYKEESQQNLAQHHDLPSPVRERVEAWMESANEPPAKSRKMVYRQSRAKPGMVSSSPRPPPAIPDDVISIGSSTASEGSISPKNELTQDSVQKQILCETSMNAHPPIPKRDPELLAPPEARTPGKRRKISGGQKIIPPPFTEELITEACAAEEDMDGAHITEAAWAALGRNGRSWWDIGLETVELDFRYGFEDEKEL